MTDEKKTKVSKSVEKLVDEVAKLSVLELSELVNALQDKLGVEAAPMAAAPAAAAAPAEGQEGGGEEAGGGANQTVVLTAPGDQKIAVIKALRRHFPHSHIHRPLHQEQRVIRGTVFSGSGSDARECRFYHIRLGIDVALRGKDSINGLRNGLIHNHDGAGNVLAGIGRDARRKRQHRKDSCRFRKITEFACIRYSLSVCPLLQIHRP